jgi:hypothetical protein
MSVSVFVDRDRLTPAIRAMIDRFPEIGDQIIRKLAFDIVAGVAERVPVDTGRYRAGWRVSLDVLAGDGTSETVDVEESGDRMRVIVTNPVEYGVYIEYGTATRAPGLQLQTTIAAARAGLGLETIAAPIVDVWEEST